MKSNNRMKKYSFIVSLVLALSLALSTVSVSAEELDTPVHEDPIDEIQYANGSSSKSFSEQYYNSSGVQEVLTFDSQITYNISWTEGFDSAFTSIVFNTTNIKIDGTLYPFTAKYPIYNVYGSAHLDYQRTNYVLTFRVNAYCDLYGDVYHNAWITKTY